MHHTFCVNYEAKIEAGTEPEWRLRLQNPVQHQDFANSNQDPAFTKKLLTKKWKNLRMFSIINFNNHDNDNETTSVVDIGIRIPNTDEDLHRINQRQKV